jgi:hypothetical protein
MTLAYSTRVAVGAGRRDWGRREKKWEGCPHPGPKIRVVKWARGQTPDTSSRKIGGRERNMIFRQKASRAWWCMPVIPVTQEAQVRGSCYQATQTKTPDHI